jgi:hypothetical protein
MTREKPINTPYLYKDIPAVEAHGRDDCPLKAFIVALELLPALGPRLFLDGPDAKEGTINPLDGPASTKRLQINLPFDKLREFLKKEERHRSTRPIPLDVSHIPQRFTFGLLDIVTYPFWFMLTHSLDMDEKDAGGQLWRVNSNLINHFYPSLREVAAVLTIAHVHEEPIDDAPVHNIVLWHDKTPEAIRSNLHALTQNNVPTHFVCSAQPIMDDRYAFHQRCPEDGQPFNLLRLKETLLDN